MKLKFYFEKNIAANAVDVYLVGQDAHGKLFYAAPMEMKFLEHQIHLRQEPTLSFNGHFSAEFFPALVNALAESGYKAESNDAGELKATKYHLEDMRNLAFGPWEPKVINKETP